MEQVQQSINTLSEQKKVSDSVLLELIIGSTIIILLTIINRGEYGLNFGTFLEIYFGGYFLFMCMGAMKSLS